jgi:toxin YoeB
MMDITYAPKAHQDLVYFFETDKKLFGKVLKLITLTSRSPFDGDGNPEPLKHNLVGYWSRRINSEHRLVYIVSDDAVRFVSCKGHYTDL